MWNWVICTRLNLYLSIRKFQNFCTPWCSGSPLWNEIWKADLLQEVIEWETKLERHVFETGRNNSTRVMWKQELLQPLWLSLDCLLELGKLSYLIWKRRFRATCWYQNIHHCPTDKYFMIIFWELLGSTKEVTFMRLYFFSYLFKIMISFIKQFKTKYRGRKNGLQPKKDRGRSKPFFRAL